MRNIILLIIRFKDFLAYATLSFIAFSLMVNFNHLQRSNWLHSAGSVTGSISAGTSGISNYFFLKTDNNKLALENARLQKELLFIKKEMEKNLPLSLSSKDSLAKNNHGPVFKGFQMPRLSIDTTDVFTPAVVINNSVNSTTNFISLNKGKKDGVLIDDGVVTENGLVGRVVSTSNNFCLVKSILHINNPVSVVLKKQNELGDLVWEGEKGNVAEIKHIPRHTSVMAGDSVFTAGYGSVYPSHHFVGRISKVELPENDAFYNLKIKLSVNYNSLKHVYIYKNLYSGELRGLNAQTDTIP